MELSDKNFNQIISQVVENAKNIPWIMTGLLAVDLEDEKLKFTRALEIIEKVLTLSSLASHSENQEVSWIDDLGIPRENLKEELSAFWANKQVENSNK